MSRRRHRLALAAVAAVIVAAAAPAARALSGGALPDRLADVLSSAPLRPPAGSGPVAPAQVYDDDGWYWRDAPPTLPQQLGGVVRAHPDAAGPQRIERIADVFRMVGSCWVIPRELVASGQELTVRLSFKRSGDILGRPRITYYKAGANPADRKPFTDSIIAALERCLPLPFSPGFGAAVAGRPFVFRFIDAPRV